MRFRRELYVEHAVGNTTVATTVVEEIDIPTDDLAELVQRRPETTISEITDIVAENIRNRLEAERVHLHSKHSDRPFNTTPATPPKFNVIPVTQDDFDRMDQGDTFDPDEIPSND